MTCGRKLGPFDCCTVVEGDCLELMKQLPPHSFDAFVCDPPFAYAGGISNGQSIKTDGQFCSFWFSAVAALLESATRDDGCGFIFTDWRTVGTGAVLLSRPEPIRGTETVNDKDGYGKEIAAWG